MDDRSNPQTQDGSAVKSSRCCGGKAGTQPQTKAGPRLAEAAGDKPVRSGCCRGEA